MSTKTNNRIAPHIRDLPRSGIRDFFELVIGRDDVVSLGVGEPDFPTPWHIREATIFALERGKTMYTSNLGLLRLREEISDYVHRKTGVRYDPKTEIIVTVGVSEALDIALRAIVTAGDEILYHTPSYVSYDPSIRMAYGEPVIVPTHMEHGFNLQASDVRSRLTNRSTALLLNYPNNPTGAAGDAEQLQHIASLAIQNDLLVIVDEIYNELTYGDFHSIAQDLPKDNMLYLNGFSKAYAMTGYRVGYACGPRDVIEGMMKIHQYAMLCAPIMAQEAAIEALRNGEDEKEQMRCEYMKRRNFIVSSLNEIGLTCSMPEGAFYAFPSVENTGRTGREFAERLLAEENVAVVPGEAFGEVGRNHIRCAFAASLDEIEFALRGMNALVKRLH